MFLSHIRRGKLGMVWWCPDLLSLIVPSSSTHAFCLMAQDDCSSSRPSVSIPVIGLEESVHFCPLKHSLLPFTSCWPGLRHEFIVRHTRKCNFFFSPEQPCALLTFGILLLKNGRMDLDTVSISSTSLLLGLWEMLGPEPISGLKSAPCIFLLLLWKRHWCED